MTDEEMADEYAREWLYHVKDLELHHKEDDKPEYIRIKQAYLDGLHEGQPKWHDLRKDPNDLPPRMGLGSEEVYVQYDTKGATDFACYRFDKNIWERSEDDEQAIGVIAWCEIPTFKE